MAKKLNIERVGGVHDFQPKFPFAHKQVAIINAESVRIFHLVKINHVRGRQVGYVDHFEAVFAHWASLTFA
jgi:hypothetical protein